MKSGFQSRSGKSGAAGGSECGFALVMTVALLALLAVVAIGFLSLSTIQIRQSSGDQYDVEAKANARLALMVALGELQKQLGPDQRVSAKAALLDRDPGTPEADGVEHPQWTGVWSTRMPDGSPVWVRDDERGGLLDQREGGWRRERELRSYLVSGNEGGREAAGSRFLDAEHPVSGDHVVELVGRASVGDGDVNLRNGRVVVQQVAVNSDRAGDGHYGFWVGDLGVRANVATRNAHERVASAAGRTREDMFQILASQEAQAEMIAEGAGGGGPLLEEADKDHLISHGQMELMAETAGDWRRRYFHDVTVHSQGVLANVREGRLKRDLTAYFASGGRMAESVAGRGDGLLDSDRLVGPANAAAAARGGVDWDTSRHKNAVPRFGLLREWARLSAQVGLNDNEIAAVPPKTLPAAPGASDDLAMSNLSPVDIGAMDQVSLVPVMVEGSMYSSVSWHRNAEGSLYPYNVRLHTYPRVVLWNPYNVNLTLDPAMVLLHMNGRKEMWTDGLMPLGNREFAVRAQWIWFVGGRNNQFRSEDGILKSLGYNDPYIGSYYFSLPKTTFGPGECLVFSPDQANEYDTTNTERNTLSPAYGPNPSLNYYFTASEIDGGMEFRPTQYWFAPTDYWNVKNQSDDFRMMLKARGTRSGITPEVFDTLPQISYVSCALQYGAGREPRVAWNESNKVKMEETALVNPVAVQVPDVRTRDGYRLRWFRENESNILASGSLVRGRDAPHFESALLANWNPRGAYSARTPWDNLAGQVARDGSGSGPWFFGAYTRDLYDEVTLGWNNNLPPQRDGTYRGNPFGPVQDFETFQERYVLFDLPRKETGVMSLAQLQHAKLSEFVWHPSYAIGQSLEDPRVRPTGTSPQLQGGGEIAAGGWDAESIGWSTDAERSSNREEWARFGRALTQNFAEADHLVYDLSFEVNHTLWDDFFFSTGDDYTKRNFLRDPLFNPLPNGRLVPAASTADALSLERLQDFHRAAYHLMLDGAFNVNSTSVEAWKALLAGTRNRGLGSTDATPFPRVMNAPGGEWIRSAPDAEEAWEGFRSLNDDELQVLAEEIVREVKRRGPFLSLSDFVNRRLSEDESGSKGPLQAAIEAAGLNAAFSSDDTFSIWNDVELPDYRHPDHIKDATRLDQTAKPASKAWGAPGYLTQGDVLQVIGSSLSARSDTFVIRAYGDAVDDAGVVRARAWCEAVVQRTPEPLRPDETGLNPIELAGGGDFGRKFVIQSFRWLNREEI